MEFWNWKKNYYKEEVVVDYERAKEILKEFQNSLRDTDIIIYGAGVVGKNMYRLLHTLELTVAHIVDRNYANCPSVGELKVEAPEEIKRYINDNREFQIFIAVNERLYDEIYAMLIEWGIPAGNVSFAFKLQKVLKSARCTKNAYENVMLDIADCFECAHVSNDCPAMWKHAKNISGYNGKGENVSISFRTTGIVLGQTCTLRCKCCNESLPYFDRQKNPFVSRETIADDLSKLAGSCEFLAYVEFVGGEPFLHPELDGIVEDILGIANIGIIRIITNGTVVPSDGLCEILANKRVIVYISNYDSVSKGRLQENVQETLRQLEKFHVIHKHGTSVKWLDFSSFDLLDDSEEELSRRFNACTMKSCRRLYKGKLYGCPHHYGGSMLKRLSETEDVIDIHSMNKSELADVLEKFSYVPYLEACKRCKLPFLAETVEAAEQLE